jgi:hypothetical protein
MKRPTHLWVYRSEVRDADLWEFTYYCEQCGETKVESRDHRRIWKTLIPPRHKFCQALARQPSRQNSPAAARKRAQEPSE